MDAGTDRCIMTEVGLSMQEFQFGIEESPVTGERITEIMFGEAIHGTIILSLMLTFKETGEPGIIPTIGINQSIENLHTVMMEGRTVFVNMIRHILIKDMLEVTLRKEPHKEKLTKAPKLPDKGTLIKVLQLGMMLQAPKSIAQVKPLKVSIPKKQKERNKV